MYELMSHISYLNAKTRNWVAAGENRWAGELVEDSEHWACMGVFTVEEFEHYMMVNTIWDLYKEARGVRPRGYNFAEMSMAELSKFYDELMVEADEVASEDEAREKEAIAEFEAKVAELIEMGAESREVAMRWLLEAEGYDGDVAYGEYCLGIPYGYVSGIKPGFIGGYA